MSRSPRRPAALLLTAWLVAASACEPAAPDPGFTFDANVNIGIAIDQPGWGKLDGHSRAGFDYDLANWLGDHLGFRPTFVDVAIGQREQFLIEGKVLMVINAYSITDKREEVIDFAGPYMVTRQGVMVRTGDKRIVTTADLPGKTVCATVGSTSIKQLEEIPGVTVRPEIGNQDCVDALLGGAVDAMSTDQLLLYGFANSDARLYVVPDLFFGHLENYGVGLPNGHRAACEKVRDALRTFLASGRWDDFFRNNLRTAVRATHRPDPNLLPACE